MRQIRIPAAFIRGGTSNAIVFKQSDLHARTLWDEIFLAAIGSPDPYGRQLNGMGGGISSLSKVCVVGPPTRADADVDYTFAQVSVSDATVDYGGNCGNMCSAIGPFAIDEGMLKAEGPSTRVRIHNTNTNKIIVACFPLDEGLAAVDGETEIAGVAGTGAPVDLDFLDPGGAGTGSLLPTGSAEDLLEVPGLGRVLASLVDAANPFVFVAADSVGLNGTEMPADIDTLAAVMDRLEAIRAVAGTMMGYAPTAAEVTERYPSVPKIGVVAPPAESATLTGERLPTDRMDLTARMVSMGKVHRALPLTGVLGLAVAAGIEGTVVHAASALRPHPGGAGIARLIRIAHPSGLVEASSEVVREQTPGDRASWHASVASVRRTQRRLFDGDVYVPASRLSAALGEAAD